MSLRQCFQQLQVYASGRVFISTSWRVHRNDPCAGPGLRRLETPKLLLFVADPGLVSSPAHIRTLFQPFSYIQIQFC